MRNTVKNINSEATNNNRTSPFKTLDSFDREESGCSAEYGRIIPAFASNNVAVCIVSSDEYSPFACVLVQSLIYNASAENNYDIVILSDDMLMRNRWRIEKQAEGHENISIRIIDISGIVKGFHFYTWAHFTEKTYYRLLTPDLFSTYDKVIYLDSDVVVDHDIAELFHIDLRGYILAAAYDTHVVSYCTRKPPLEQREYNINVLKMEDPEQYFQVGVSLFNIKEIRENYENGYLINQGLTHKLRWLDQDLLNMLFYGKIKRLPNKWNVMVSNLPENLDEYYLPEDLRKEYYEARKNPYIVHYVGRAIPCYTTEPDLFENFWKYARKTPFYEILVQRMAIDYVQKQMEYLRKEFAEGQLRKESFIKKVKRYVRLFTDIILPVGSIRRLKVKKILFYFKKWN